jgi:hypothetical protein
MLCIQIYTVSGCIKLSVNLENSSMMGVYVFTSIKMHWLRFACVQWPAVGAEISCWPVPEQSYSATVGAGANFELV